LRHGDDVSSLKKKWLPDGFALIIPDWELIFLKQVCFPASPGDIFSFALRPDIR